MNPKLTISSLINISCITLTILIFASKLSLKWAKLIPYSIPPFIFQYGLHPYINFGLQILISLFLIFIWLNTKELKPMSLIYKNYVYAMIVILSLQTLFQITIVNTESSVSVQIAGLLMAIMLVLIYGIIIPSMFDLSRFIYWIKKLVYL